LCVNEWLWNMHIECCNMFLILGACKSQVGTGAPHYPGQHNLEANVF